MFNEEISEEELSKLELITFEGSVVLVEDNELMKVVCHLLKNEKFLGFDTETKPSFKKGENNYVSLLQLSSADRAFLFRLNKIGLPPCLLDIMEDENIKKIGVAIKDDISALQKHALFTPNGFVDLQNIVKDFGIKSKSLKKLAGLIIGFNISKRQRLSNWEKDALTEAQIKYAATDAWVCHLIYHKLFIQN
jgi:ribonuclease D